MRAVLEGRMPGLFALALSLALLPQCLGVMMATEDQWRESEQRRDGTQVLIALGLRGPDGARNDGPPAFTADQFYSEAEAFCDPSPCLDPLTDPHPIYKASPTEKERIEEIMTALEERKKIQPVSEPPLHEMQPPAEMSFEAIVRPQPLRTTLDEVALLYNNKDTISAYEASRLMLADMQHATKGAGRLRRYELKQWYARTIPHLARINALIAYNAEFEEPLLDPTWLLAEKLLVIQIRRELLRELAIRNIWKNKGDIDNYLRLFPEYFAAGEVQL